MRSNKELNHLEKVFFFFCHATALLIHELRFNYEKGVKVKVKVFKTHSPERDYQRRSSISISHYTLSTLVYLWSLIPDPVPMTWFFSNGVLLSC